MVMVKREEDPAPVLFASAIEAVTYIKERTEGGEETNLTINATEL